MDEDQPGDDQAWCPTCGKGIALLTVQEEVERLGRFQHRCPDGQGHFTMTARELEAFAVERTIRDLFSSLSQVVRGGRPLH